MEILAFSLGGWLLLTLLVAGFSGANGKWDLEDCPVDEPPAKVVRKIDGRTTTPKQPAAQSETIVKSPGKPATLNQDPGKTMSVGSVMQRQPYYCFENQSLDEVRKTMREFDLQFLVVLDKNLRVVGLVKMADLDGGKKHDPPAPDS